MSDSDNSYRVWLAGNAEWEPGPTFNHLALAIDRARRLAVTQWVAIELPTQEWHVFDESQTTRLGPPQFARGSNLDLSDRAAAATDEPEEKRTRDFPRASTGNNNTYRVSGLRATRPINRTPTNPTTPPTRTPTSRTSSSQPVQRAPRPAPAAARPAPATTPPATARPAPATTPPARPSGFRRAQRTTTAREINERRAAERFAADEVLGEPACYVEGQRAEVVDVSETGLQLVIPPRTRLPIDSRTVLAFADSHGRFDLLVKVMWSRGGHIGVSIEDGAANLVGKMFLRKLIGQIVARREARNKRSR